MSTSRDHVQEMIFDSLRAEITARIAPLERERESLVNATERLAEIDAQLTILNEELTAHDSKAAPVKGRMEALRESQRQAEEAAKEGEEKQP